MLCTLPVMFVDCEHYHLTCPVWFPLWQHSFGLSLLFPGVFWQSWDEQDEKELEIVHFLALYTYFAIPRKDRWQERCVYFKISTCHCSCSDATCYALHRRRAIRVVSRECKISTWEFKNGTVKICYFWFFCLVGEWSLRWVLWNNIPDFLKSTIEVTVCFFALWNEAYALVGYGEHGFHEWYCCIPIPFAGLKSGSVSMCSKRIVERSALPFRQKGCGGVKVF